MNQRQLAFKLYGQKFIQWAIVCMFPTLIVIIFDSEFQGRGAIWALILWISATMILTFFAPEPFRDLILGWNQIYRSGQPTDKVVAQLEANHKRHPASPITLLLLANAYAYSGQVELADQWISRAMLALRRTNWCDKREAGYQHICNVAYFTLSDVLSLKGEFVKGALALDERLPSVKKPYTMLVAQSWYFLVGWDMERARAAFDRACTCAEQRMGGSWDLIVVYLHVKLRG